jgi:[ribosomal protein S18]-alanine N-acetyltransferase
LSLALNIRLAREDDIATIRTLEQEAFGLTWDRQTFLKELVRPNGATLVAEWQGQTVGAALLVWAADEVQLNSLVIGPSWRGRGLSLPFLGSLMAWCRRELFSWITLEVKWRNEPAHRLYRRLGFVTTARRCRYYKDGQDARIMWAGHLASPRFGRLLQPFPATAF